MQAKEMSKMIDRKFLMAVSLTMLIGGSGLYASAATIADVTGNWQVQLEIHANGMAMAARPLCAFQQKGEDLSGTCKGPSSEGPITGTVKGQQVSFTWKTARGEWTFNGNLDGIVITGSGTGPGSDVKGPFTAKKQ
jgi:hypothetical protein